MSFAGALAREMVAPRSTYMSHTLFEAVAFVHSGLHVDIGIPDLQMFILPLSYPENQGRTGLRSTSRRTHRTRCCPL